MRKRSAVAERKRRAINSKITDDLRSKIEAAAALSGRTVSHEIEYRLEHSFEAGETIDAVVEKVRQTVVDLIINTSGGPQAYCVGAYVTQLIGLADMDAQSQGWGGWDADERTRGLALEYITSRLPKMLAKPPTQPLTNINLTTLAEVVNLRAASDAPSPPKPTQPPEPVKMPKGMKWERPERLKDYKPLDIEGDIFREVADSAKVDGGTSARRRKRSGP